MKSISRAFRATILPLVLAGCGAAPFATSNPSIRPPDGVQVVSVCYHANNTTREAVRAIAVKECTEEESTLKFWHHDTTLNDCPVLAKTRVSFLCLPPAK